MTPAMPINYSADARLGDTKSSSKLVLSFFAFTNKAHRVWRQFRLWQLVPNFLATLRNHVGRVVRLCPKKQMTRVDTWRVVAAMQHTKPCRYFSVSKLPSHSVSHKKTLAFLSVASFCYLTVAGLAGAALPNPTRLSLLRFCPKTI